MLRQNNPNKVPTIHFVERTKETIVKYDEDDDEKYMILKKYKNKQLSFKPTGNNKQLLCSTCSTVNLKSFSFTLSLLLY